MKANDILVSSSISTLKALCNCLLIAFEMSFCLKGRLLCLQIMGANSPLLLLVYLMACKDITPLFGPDEKRQKTDPNWGNYCPKEFRKACCLSHFIQVIWKGETFFDTKGSSQKCFSNPLWKHKDENITEALRGLVFTVLSESIHTPRLLSHFVVLQPEFKMD